MTEPTRGSVRVRLLAVVLVVVALLALYGYLYLNAGATSAP